MKMLFTIIFGLALFGICAGLGGFAWFEFMPPTTTCVSCHEIRGAKEGWAHSAHTNVSCKACHGGTASSVDALCDNVRRAWKHVTKAPREVLRKDMPLSEAQVDRMSAACGKCHREEYANWARSGHSAPISKFLTDEAHNAAWKLADQCLRCHGMFLEGNACDILSRVSAEGRFARVQTAEELPRLWYFKNPQQGRRAAVPCLACHRGHPMRGDDPAAKFRAQGSVAFYSRAERLYFEPWQLYLQNVATTRIPNSELIKQSADPKRKLCQQCHAANAYARVGSGDDRTPTGVHEGISCVACHGAHCNDPRKSCGACHSKCIWPAGVKSPIHGKN